MRILILILCTAFTFVGCAWQPLEQPKILTPTEILAECEAYWTTSSMSAGLSESQKLSRINDCTEREVQAAEALPAEVLQTPADLMRSCLDYYGTQYTMVIACAKVRREQAAEVNLSRDELRAKCRNQLKAQYSGREFTNKVNACVAKKSGRRTQFYTPYYLYY